MAAVASAEPNGESNYCRSTWPGGEEPGAGVDTWQSGWHPQRGIMETDKVKKLLSDQDDAGDQQSESVRTPVTVLFSDIKGSTAYFEKFGDDQGLAMVQRHNGLLFPVIEGSGGRVVKTIGDAIMAVFADPRGALQGAIGMQRVLESDRISRPGEEQIHIKVGLHTGPCIVKDKDVYGDVVNVASRVQNQTEPDQILITEDLLEAAKRIGVQ